MRTTRYEFLDLLRGIAVLLMIEGHAMRALLHWNIRATFEFDIHELFHGLPAPIFIFAAGAAVALTRRNPQQDPSSPSAGVRRKDWRRNLRLLNVLIIAYGLQLSEFSFARTFFSSTLEQQRILLNFNVLQCIVVGVLLVRWIISLRIAETRICRILVAATAVVGLATPLMWMAAPHLPMWVSTMISKQYASYFPIFPYVGFALGGAAWAMWFRQSTLQDKEAGFLPRSILFSGIIFAGCTALAAVPWPPPYADFWSSSPWFLWLRIALLTVLCGYLRRWELNSRDNPGRVHGFLALLGRQSFYAYVGHLVVLFGSSYNYRVNMLRMMGSELALWPAVLATTCLMVWMIATTIAWDWTKRNRKGLADSIKWSLAAYLLFVFLISSAF